MNLPAEYEDLTLRELLVLYGRRPDECPPELRGWLRCALELEELLALRRENDAREVALAIGSLTK